jgi:hypothetical protein
MNDGGPAYPTLGDSYMQVADGSWQPKSYYGMQGEPGMSLRDYFAAQALTGLLHIGAEPTASPRVLAEYAYKFADAMLAHRAAAAERGEGQ